jgi:hypothetical protein
MSKLLKKQRSRARENKYRGADWVCPECSLTVKRRSKCRHIRQYHPDEASIYICSETGGIKRGENTKVKFLSKAEFKLITPFWTCPIEGCSGALPVRPSGNGERNTMYKAIFEHRDKCHIGTSNEKIRNLKDRKATTLGHPNFWSMIARRNTSTLLKHMQAKKTGAYGVHDVALVVDPWKKGARIYGFCYTCLRLGCRTYFEKIGRNLCGSHAESSKWNQKIHAIAILRRRKNMPATDSPETREKKFEFLKLLEGQIKPQGEGLRRVTPQVSRLPNQQHQQFHENSAGEGEVEKKIQLKDMPKQWQKALRCKTRGNDSIKSGHSSKGCEALASVASTRACSQVNQIQRSKNVALNKFMSRQPKCCDGVSRRE